jgi:hypothetical protein
MASRVTLIEGQYATTGSNTFTGVQYISQASNASSFTSTASLYTAGGMRVGKDMYVSGTAYFNNVTVYGTQSVNYITSSQLDISDNIITVNTFTPAVRYGGLGVYDSGSTGLSGSMLWDSEQNRWIYSNPSGSSYDGGMIISGPRNTTGLGNEQGTLANYVTKGQGGDHITSSAIYETASLVGIGTASPAYNLDVTGTGRFTSNVLLGSSAVNNYLLNLYDTIPRIHLTNATTGTATTDGFHIYQSGNDSYVLNKEAANLYLGSNNGINLTIASGGAATFSSSVGVGTSLSSTTAAMVVENAGIYGSWIELKATSTGGKRWIVQSTGVSAGEGAGKFVINNATDAIDAVVISSTGNVGIGTQSPEVMLQLGSNDSTNKVFSVRYSSVPLYINGGYDGTYALSTFSTNNYNTSAGSTSWGGFSNTLYSSAAVQLASSTVGSEVRFYTAAAPNTNPTERMRITSGGYLKASNTGVYLDAVTTTQHEITNSSGGSRGLQVNNSSGTCTSEGIVFTYSPTTTSGNFYHISCYTGGNGYRFRVSDGGTIYAVNTTVQSVSDIRFKENIRDIDTGLNEILALKPRRFDWKEGKGMNIKNAIGFIAQEVEEVLPELIGDWKDTEEDETAYKSLGMTNMIPTLVKAIQEQQTLIESLTSRLEQLEGK